MRWRCGYDVFGLRYRVFQRERVIGTSLGNVDFLFLWLGNGRVDHFYLYQIRSVATLYLSLLLLYLPPHTTDTTPQHALLLPLLALPHHSLSLRSTRTTRYQQRTL
jgi:hypothetical protein